MDTQQLIQECNSGCKMAIYSMNQVIEYVGNENLKKLIEKYKYSHENLEEESSELLQKMGKEEKEPEIKKEVKPVNKVNNKTNNKNISKNTKNKKN